MAALVREMGAPPFRHRRSTSVASSLSFIVTGTSGTMHGRYPRKPSGGVMALEKLIGALRKIASVISGGPKEVFVEAKPREECEEAPQAVMEVGEEAVDSSDHIDQTPVS
jgi:hypothetical protein